MKRARSAAIAFGILVLALWGIALPAGAQGQTLKEIMGENFAGLQSILVSLIRANYATVPQQIAVIEEHANHLTHNVPASATGDRDRFLSYAYSLRTNAQDLDSIVRTLIEHDRGKEMLSYDDLREAAAAHYGGMVTMCVACHNRFRPTVIH
jgi:hypothetical protein